jgi:hypothetical protein
VSELRSNAYRLLDQVIETGTPIEIERKGFKVKVVSVGQVGSKLLRLSKHACIRGDPESLVHMDWSGTWKGNQP